VCKTRPEVCPAIYQPVCGCDDKPYPSACAASAAGISVAREGECAAPTSECEYRGQQHKVGETYPAEDGCNTCICGKDGQSACTAEACMVQSKCGSRGLPECGKGQYCNFDPTAQCGRADAPGLCSAIPGACTKDYKPVCGCDDTTYPNACSAAAAGVSVLHTGECGGCDYNGQHYA
jgi:hypothetical protein